jgi:DoxX
VQAGEPTTASNGPPGAAFVAFVASGGDDDAADRKKHCRAARPAIAMSLLFIHGGWGKLLAPAATQAMLASHHLPMVKYGWILAVVVELGGGLAILFGLFTRPVGLVLAIWCAATALIAHMNFTDRTGVRPRSSHQAKNRAQARA